MIHPIDKSMVLQIWQAFHVGPAKQAMLAVHDGYSLLSSSRLVCAASGKVTFLPAVLLALPLCSMMIGTYMSNWTFANVVLQSHVHPLVQAVEYKIKA